MYEINALLYWGASLLISLIVISSCIVMILQGPKKALQHAREMVKHVVAFIGAVGKFLFNGILTLFQRLGRYILDILRGDSP